MISGSGLRLFRSEAWLSRPLSSRLGATPLSERGIAPSVPGGVVGKQLLAGLGRV